MPKNPRPTIRITNIYMRSCPHCGTVTVQVGKHGNTCLQCIADGGTCCSLAEFNRWK